MKAKVEQICHDYATGNGAKAVEAGREVCVEVIDSIPGSSAEKQKALERCAVK